MKNAYKIKILQKKNSDGVSFFFKMGTYIQNSTRFAWLVPFDKLRDRRLVHLGKLSNRLSN